MLPCPALPSCLSSRRLSADQLKEVLCWWGGGGEDGEESNMTAPCIEKMEFSNNAKGLWAQAILKQVEPGSTYNPASSKWQSLRRAMPHAARALLHDLGGHRGRRQSGVGQAP